jgi:hypothetical protein
MPESNWVDSPHSEDGGAGPIPLLEAGVDLTCLDASEGMLARLNGVEDYGDHYKALCPF